MFRLLQNYHPILQIRLLQNCRQVRLIPRLQNYQPILRRQLIPSTRLLQNYRPIRRYRPIRSIRLSRNYRLIRRCQHIPNFQLILPWLRIQICRHILHCRPVPPETLTHPFPLTQPIQLIRYIRPLLNYLPIPLNRLTPRLFGLFK